MNKINSDQKQRILNEVQEILKDLKREKGIRIDVIENVYGTYQVVKYTTSKVAPYAEYRSISTIDFEDVRKLLTAIKAIVSYLVIE